MSLLTKPKSEPLEASPFRLSDAGYTGEASEAYGITLRRHGHIAAFGGLVLIGHHWWTFFDIVDERVRRPMLIHRLVRQGLAFADECGMGPIYGYCDTAKPQAETWIRRLGFVPWNGYDDAIRQVEDMVQHRAWIRHDGR